MNFKHIKHNLWRSECGKYEIQRICDSFKFYFQATYRKTFVAMPRYRAEAEQACIAHAAAKTPRETAVA